MAESTSIKVEWGESPGMAQMVSALLRHPVETNPKLVRKMRGSLAMRATDREAGVTIGFKVGEVTITGTVDHKASVLIEAPILTLGKLGQGGHSVGSLFKGEAKVKGALRHPLFLMRARKLLQSSS